MRRFYHRCEVVLAPAEITAAILRAQRMNRDITIWARGIDREQFNPERRDMKWRRSLGIADDEMVVAFLGRVVMKKASTSLPMRSKRSRLLGSSTACW